jgi:hypothetical protein
MPSTINMGIPGASSSVAAGSQNSPAGKRVLLAEPRTTLRTAIGARRALASLRAAAADLAPRAVP